MKRALWLLCVMLLATTAGIAQIDTAAVIEKYKPELEKIVDMSRALRNVHPFFESLYPIAIAEADRFFLFDLDSKGDGYVFVKESPIVNPVPEGLRAAFPLDFYDNRMACVVTGDAFFDLPGRVAVFHEFVHCRQGETIEQKLKDGLGVARKAAGRQDFMWELNHPFPYQDPLFSEIYSLFLEAAARRDDGVVQRCRMNLKEILNDDDFEYMVWQEWKEGFARYLENLARVELGLEENRGGGEPPFSRVSFYAGGAALIDLLIREDPALIDDIETLFERIKSFSF